MEYAIETANTAADLVVKVNILIEAGWRPKGSLVVVDGTYLQVMLRTP